MQAQVEREIKPSFVIDRLHITTEQPPQSIGLRETRVKANYNHALRTALDIIIKGALAGSLAVSAVAGGECLVNIPTPEQSQANPLLADPNIPKRSFIVADFPEVREMNGVAARKAPSIPLKGDAPNTVIRIPLGTPLEGIPNSGWLATRIDGQRNPLFIAVENLQEVTR